MHSWRKSRTDSQRYKTEYDIPDYDIEIITSSKHMADLFEETVACGAAPKKVSNWLMVETLRLLKEKGLDPEDIRFSPAHLARLIALAESRVINSTVAKEVFEAMFEEDVDPDVYVEENGLKMVSEEGALLKTVKEVIAANPKSVEDYRGGKEKAIGFLVGQTMKAMKGKADPGAVGGRKQGSNQDLGQVIPRPALLGRGLHHIVNIFACILRVLSV